MGRTPCCDKSKVKRGPWSPEEDEKLKNYLHKHGTAGNWISLPPKAGLKRCGKSCRLRWLNYLRPDIKHGVFTEDEDEIIFTLYSKIGSRWSIIASQLNGRTDNDVKNHWNTKLKKKLSSSSSSSMENSIIIPTKPSYNNNINPTFSPSLISTKTPFSSPSANNHEAIIFNTYEKNIGFNLPNYNNNYDYGNMNNFWNFSLSPSDQEGVSISGSSSISNSIIAVEDNNHTTWSGFDHRYHHHHQQQQQLEGYLSFDVSSSSHGNYYYDEFMSNGVWSTEQGGRVEDRPSTTLNTGNSPVRYKL